MSDDPDWEEILRRIEQGRGEPLSPDERRRAAQMWPDVKRFVAEASAIIEERENSPLVAFVRKLIARQGTTMPDFDALYRRKAELDHDPAPNRAP